MLESAGDHQIRIEIESGVLQAQLIAGDAFLGRAQPVQSREHADALVSAIGQMAHQPTHVGAVTGHDIITVGVGDAVDLNHGDNYCVWRR